MDIEHYYIEKGFGNPLILLGDKDMTLEAHTRLIAQAIPDSQLVFIQGNHFIANKKPEAFNRVVLDFLGQ